MLSLFKKFEEEGNVKEEKQLHTPTVRYPEAVKVLP
jgi:hypothetical protein